MRITQTFRCTMVVAIILAVSGAFIMMGDAVGEIGVLLPLIVPAYVAMLAGDIVDNVFSMGWRGWQIGVVGTTIVLLPFVLVDGLLLLWRRRRITATRHRIP